MTELDPLWHRAPNHGDRFAKYSALPAPRHVKPTAWLPEFLTRRLAGRETLQRSIDNGLWLFADQMIRMIAGLVVGVWVARYLGPTRYGWLNYAAALVGSVGAFTSLGLGSVVVREMVREPQAARGWLGAFFFLRAVAAVLGVLACVVLAWLQPAEAGPAQGLVMIAAVGLLFQTFDVYDSFFQARGDAQVGARVRIAACLAANLLKVALILSGASLPAIACATAAELGLSAVGWAWSGARGNLDLRRLECTRAGVFALWREGWPLAVSGFAVYTQAYADQVIIGLLMGAEDLGQYAAAMRIVSMAAFVPMLVQTVAAPEITRAGRVDPALYRRRLYDFYRLMFVLFLVTALPLALAGPWAARHLFGPAYAPAASLLPLLAFRLFFTTLGVARSVFITNEHLFRFALGTGLAGAAANLILNAWFIPRWGVIGAIWASFGSFAVSNLVCDALQPRARYNLRLMARAALTPWRPLSD